MELARKQGAKSSELRAAIHYARLVAADGDRDAAKEAVEQLKLVYNWFTEGFDTKDLKEAKALLDELSA
jgi:predicted ATPase